MVYVTTGDNYSDPRRTLPTHSWRLTSRPERLAWSSQMSQGRRVQYRLRSSRRESRSIARNRKGRISISARPRFWSICRMASATLVAGAKSGVVYAVDPDARGKLLWQRRVGQGGTLGGVQWGSAADANNIYVAVSGRAAPCRGGRIAGGTRFRLRRALRARSENRRRAFCAESCHRRHRMAHAASRLHEARMQSRAIRGGHRDSGSGVFGWRRRALARLFRGGRPHHLGRRHRARIQTVNGVKANGRLAG